jgi:CubicO group peptidase (beta-lactamase class C family)
MSRDDRFTNDCIESPAEDRPVKDESTTNEQDKTVPEPGRRDFMQAAAAATIGGLTGLGSFPESAAAADDEEQGRWVARHGLTDAEYQNVFDKFVNRGYRLTNISGYGVDGQARYAALWEKREGPAWRARHGMTASEYQNAFDKFDNRGYRLSHVSGYSVNGGARFAAIWEKRDGPAWRARHGMTASEYQNAFDKFVNRGYRLTHITGYAVTETGSTTVGETGTGESARYAAIWEKRDGPAWRTHHGLTASEYQNAFSGYSETGYRLQRVTGFSVDGEPRFAAIWEKRDGPGGEARHGLTDDEYQDQFNELVYQGYRPTDVSGYSVPDTYSTNWGTFTLGESPRYAANWEADAMAEDDIEAIDRQLSNYMHQEDVPGVSLAITKDERLVFAKGYGKADKSADEEMYPSHRFRIASLSKPITAVAIMTLVEAGRLNLDDVVFGSDGIFGGEYGRPSHDALSDSDPNRISVNHLLEHTAGWTVRNGDKDDPMLNHSSKDQDELIEWVIDNWEFDNEPGANYSYLNFGYCVLGRVIEEVTGRPYETYVTDEVLSNCGIDRMEIAGDSRSDRKADEVVYYGGSPYHQQVERMDAHGGWLASPIDLLRFVVRVDEFGRKPDILTPSTEREMYNREGDNPDYGKGWATHRNSYSHNGSLDGTQATMVRRGDGFSFVALVNGNGSNSNLRSAVNTAISNVSDWPDHDLF